MEQRANDLVLASAVLVNEHGDGDRMGYVGDRGPFARLALVLASREDQGTLDAL